MRGGAGGGVPRSVLLALDAPGKRPGSGSGASLLCIRRSLDEFDKLLKRQLAFLLVERAEDIIRERTSKFSLKRHDNAYRVETIGLE
nr:hypothetical protein [uncultured Roseibium sp.]